MKARILIPLLASLCLAPDLACAQAGKLISQAPIKPGDCPQGTANGLVIDAACNPPANGVQSFNGRTGAVVPQASDYASFFAPANPPSFLAASASVTAAQINAFTPLVVTGAGVTLTYPSTASAGTGGSAVLTEGGQTTIQANAADQICINGTCSTAGASQIIAQGQMVWIFSDGKGHLDIGF